MKKTILILLLASVLVSCGTQRYCQPSKRSKDYADLYLKDGGAIDSLYTRCILVSVKRSMWGYKHLFIADSGDSLQVYYQKKLKVNECYKVPNKL